jgi:hypothetical protein
VKLQIAKLRLDGGTQPRAIMNGDLVADYRDLLEAGVTLPSVVVYFDGTDHWLADGFHRVYATEELGRDTIDAQVVNGTQRDAILYSCGANASHGLPRTNADKKRAVETLLADPEWCARSDRWVAEHAAVSGPYVAKLRPGANVCTSRDGQDGKTYPVKPKAERPPVTPVRPAEAEAHIATTEETATFLDENPNLLTTEDLAEVDRRLIAKAVPLSELLPNRTALDEAVTTEDAYFRMLGRYPDGPVRRALLARLDARVMALP